MLIQANDVEDPRFVELIEALHRAPEIDLPAHLDEGTLAVLCYTSGTTGRPKGARITHKALGAMVESLHEAWGWRGDDVLVHALPLFHIHGLFVAQHGAWRAGATSVWLERFSAEGVFAALEDGATVFMGVPTFYHRLLGHVGVPDLRKMRLFTSGSAGLPADEHRAFRERFGHEIVERYGMTEVGIVLSNPLRGERVPGSVGLPLPGVRAKVTDLTSGEQLPPQEVGEIRIAGPTLFEGYHNRPGATKLALEEGWMHTGDLGFVDERGYFFLVGRHTDMVISGGLNVYPAEVEAALLSHHAVDEVAVLGLPDADLGERVVAAVVGRATLEELRAYAGKTLASYKLPKEVIVVPDLPRNAMGKVTKAVLRRSWREPWVRRAVPVDLSFLCDNNVRLAQETEGLTLPEAAVRRGVRGVLDGEVGAFYFVAELQGRPVGQLMITTEWSDWRGCYVWWIQSVYVHARARRRGVFRALFDAATSGAKAAGAAGLRLYVDRRNEEATRVYEVLGMDAGHYRLFEQLWA